MHDRSPDECLKIKEEIADANNEKIHENFSIGNKTAYQRYYHSFNVVLT